MYPSPAPPIFHMFLRPVSATSATVFGGELRSAYRAGLGHRVGLTLYTV